MAFKHIASIYTRIKITARFYYGVTKIPYLTAKMLCVRRHSTTSNALNIDEKFYNHLMNCILNDGNVQFYWCMAGLDESNDHMKCLEMIVKKWVSIRRHSFADNIMELYKQKEKKGTKKSRSQVC